MKFLSLDHDFVNIDMILNIAAFTDTLNLCVYQRPTVECICMRLDLLLAYLHFRLNIINMWQLVNLDPSTRSYIIVVKELIFKDLSSKIGLEGCFDLSQYTASRGHRIANNSHNLIFQVSCILDIKANQINLLLPILLRLSNFLEQEDDTSRGTSRLHKCRAGENLAQFTSTMHSGSEQELLLPAAL